MFILCLRLGICQVRCNRFEPWILCSKLTEFLLRLVPVTRCTGCVIGKSLAPGSLEWSRRSIQVQVLYQCPRTIAGLQEAGATLIRQTEADDTYYRTLVIQRWSTTITMLHITTHLNHLCSLICCLNRTDKNLVDR